MIAAFVYKKLITTIYWEDPRVLGQAIQPAAQLSSGIKSNAFSNEDDVKDFNCSFLSEFNLNLTLNPWRNNIKFDTIIGITSTMKSFFQRSMINNY